MTIKTWPQAAIELLEEKGWGQGLAVDGDGRHCLSASLDLTMDHRRDECAVDVWIEIEKLANEKVIASGIDVNDIDFICTDLTKLNDFVYKTKEEAIGFLGELHIRLFEKDNVEA